MKKATLTQNSASISMAALSALEHLVDGLVDRLGGRRGSNQMLNDGGGGIHRDGVHVGHRGGLGRRNGGFSLGELRVELFLERAAARLGLGHQLVVGIASDRVR